MSLTPFQSFGRRFAERASWTTMAMFAIVFLLHCGFALLRSARMAIAVADLGGSAACLPLFEIFAAVPLSILVMGALNRLMQKRSLISSYRWAMAGFLLFFVLFVFVAYPRLESLRNLDPALLNEQSVGWRRFWLMGAGGLFYAVSELWRTVLITVLFWSATNHWLLPGQASAHYPRLVLVGSLGAMAAGPLATLTTSSWWQSAERGGSSWQQTLELMTFCLVGIGIVSLWLFSRMWRGFQSAQTEQSAEKSQEGPRSTSLRESAILCTSSLPLLYLAIGTLTDYISYSLGEIVFLDALKQWAPAPEDFYRSMGLLGTLNGILTALGGAWLAPWWFRRLGWGAAAMATPVAIALLGLSFCSIVWFQPFLVAWGLNARTLLGLAVALGGCHYVICRATKYTLFDPAKELAFMKIDPAQRMAGKVIVDGMVSRVGRGLSAMMTLGLTTLTGSLRETAGVGGLIATLFASIGGWSAYRLNQALHGPTGEQTHQQAGEARPPIA